MFIYWKTQRKPCPHNKPIPLRRGLAFYRLLLLTIVWLFPAGETLALNPDVSIDKYLHRQWSSRDGLPQNTVTCFTQDAQGFIWIGTENGLARFDGDEFIIYNRINTPELKHNSIRSLYVSRDGTILIGTDGGGITIFNEKRRTHFSTKEGLPSPFIRSIGGDSHGNLWVTTDSGEMTRFRLNESRLIPSPTKNNTASPVKPAPAKNISGLPGVMLGGIVHQVVNDRGNMRWAVTDNGLYRISGNRGEKIEKVKGIEALDNGTPVISLFLDRSGRLWIGTRGNGMICLRDSGFTFYTIADGLSHNCVTTIYQDKQQTIWIGTNGGGLNQFKQGRFKTYTREDGLCSNYITSISRDNQGSLWVGTPKGLNRLLEGQVDLFTSRDGLTADAISALYADKKGNLWIGTGSGLTGYKNGRFFVPYTGQELQNKVVMSIAEDIYKDLWVGTDRGLYYLQLSLKRPLLQKISPAYAVRDIYIDVTGVIWLATSGQGILRFVQNDNRFTPYPADCSLATAGIYKIFEDDKRNLWASSNHGFYVVPKDAFEWNRKRLPWQQPYPPRYFRFLESDGLLSPVFTGGIQPAGCRTKDGEIWLPTTAGITVLQPDSIKPMNPVLPVVIETVTAAGKTFIPKGTMSFSRGTRKFEFTYTALNFQGVEDLQFKCRLQSLFQGGIGSLEQITGHKSVVFANIPPAKYEFSIRAGNDDQGWGEPASFHFTVDYTIGGTELVIFVMIILLPILLVVISRLIDHKAKEKEMMRIFQDDARYRTHVLEQKRGKKYMLDLLTVMETEKPYLDPNMSVSKMAKRLGVPKEHISQIINQRFYMNFNQFLNKYRIEEAKKRLKDPKESQFVVLKIAHDVGFNSKSTFNTAFKKFTGMSPSQYRETHLEKTGTES